jgi:hypothetical protein
VKSIPKNENQQNMNSCHFQTMKHNKKLYVKNLDRKIWAFFVCLCCEIFESFFWWLTSSDFFPEGRKSYEMNFVSRKTSWKFFHKKHLLKSISHLQIVQEQKRCSCSNHHVFLPYFALTQKSRDDSLSPKILQSLYNKLRNFYLSDFVGFSFDLVPHVLGENYKHLLCDIRFCWRGKNRKLMLRCLNWDCTSFISSAELFVNWKL